MTSEEFAVTVANLVQVAWAAAAGQLQLSADRCLKAEVFGQEQPSPDEPDLIAGLCLNQNKVSSMVIALRLDFGPRYLQFGSLDTFTIGPPNFGRKGSYKITPVVR